MDRDGDRDKDRDKDIDMDVDRRGYRCPTQWFMTIPPYGQLTQVLTCLDMLSESKMTQDRPAVGATHPWPEPHCHIVVPCPCQVMDWKFGPQSA